MYGVRDTKWRTLRTEQDTVHHIGKQNPKYPSLGRVRTINDKNLSYWKYEIIFFLLFLVENNFLGISSYKYYYDNLFSFKLSSIFLLGDRGCFRGQ